MPNDTELSETEFTNNLDEHMAGIPLDVVAEPPAEQTATVAVTVTINGDSETFTASAASSSVAGAKLAQGLRASTNDAAWKWIDQHD